MFRMNGDKTPGTMCSTSIRLTVGANNVSLIEVQKHKSVQRGTERILGGKNKIPWIREQTKTEDILVAIKKEEWTWQVVLHY